MVESKILQDAIQNTQRVMEVVEGMKFARIEAETVDECSSLEEIKVFLENYFIKSLGSFDLDCNWDEVVSKVKKRIEGADSLVELIVKVKKLFAKVFAVKADWVRQKEILAFYVDSGFNIDDVTFSLKDGRDERGC